MYNMPTIPSIKQHYSTRSTEHHILNGSQIMPAPCLARLGDEQGGIKLHHPSYR